MCLKWTLTFGLQPILQREAVGALSLVDGAERGADVAAAMASATDAAHVLESSPSAASVPVSAEGESTVVELQPNYKQGEWNVILKLVSILEDGVRIKAQVSIQTCVIYQYSREW